MLCQYRNVLGEPGKGVHFHVMGVAVVDLTMTIVASVLIAKLTGYRFLPVFLILMLLAIVLHRIFCVNTTLNKLIFGKV